MKFFSQIKKTAKATIHNQLSVREQVERDWGLMLIGFVVLVLVVVGLSGRLFFRINRGDFFTSNGPADAASIVSSQKVLVDTVNFFTDREKSYQASRSAASSQIDPSI